MKLQEKLPKYIKLGKRKIKVDLDFRNVLNIIEILEDQNLTPEAREWNAMRCICRRPAKGMFPVVYKMLFPKVKKIGNKVTDFEQDADLIRVAFLQAYGINLYRDKLHWFEFSELMSHLPAGSRYSEIINIRAMPMPEPTKYNEKERVWLANAKSEFGLKLSEDEMQKKYEQDVQNIGKFLIALSGEGEKNG